MNEKIIKLIEKKYRDIFGSGNTRLFHSPGRVNIIGEHIDYNGGQVLPAALSLGTYAAAALRTDNIIRIASLNMKEKKTFSPAALEYKKEDGWANYLKGVMLYLKNRGCPLPGMNILIYGDLPHSSGLSSSASVELLTGIIVSRLSDFNIDNRDLALLAHEVENKYIGVNCGIMDQYVIALGKKNQLLLIDCGNIRHKYIPFSAGKYAFIIINSNKKRGLADSAYNERRSTCEKAVRKFQTMYPTVKFLCELTPSQIEAGYDILTDEERRRAEHVVFECQRVKESVKLLKYNDFYMFGKKLNESHDSLRDNYEVSCSELDTIVDESRKIKGVLGVRMTGAGFGGCVVALIEKCFAEEFSRKVGETYSKKTGLKADFYNTEISDGAREISDQEVSGAE
ncbi:MAG: galactokinase [Spirochaetes bacterium GWF1_41_5]|nr:MAG: galactokinase [Spirochaetes bacterium GWF1_41_5]